MLRRGVMLLGVLVVAGCGASASAVRAPFATAAFTEAGGRSVLESGPGGVTLRFVPNTTLALGIVLRNRSAKRVTILDVEAPSQPRGLLQQIGTVLEPWNPPRCPATHSCPGYGFLKAPYGDSRPEPVTVPPRGEAAVQLDFRLRRCTAVPLAAAGGPARVDVTYRAGGAVGSQEISLGSSRLRLRMPSRRDCLPRPRSEITVDGPYATGSDWAMPTSSGDSCTKTPSGSLVFASRVYLAPGKPTVRIWIRLPRFRGIGLYRTIGEPAPALGPARVTAVVGRRHFRSSTAVVGVRRMGAKTVEGRFRAAITGPRRSTFRVYGAWRCELGAP